MFTIPSHGSCLWQWLTHPVGERLLLTHYPRADGTRENGEDVDLLNQTDEQY